MPGTIMPSPKFLEVDANGAPLAGGKLWTYLAGTTTPIATFSDVDLAVPHPNPVILDGAGRATVYLSPTSYKFVLTDANDVQVWEQDFIEAVPSARQDVDIAGVAGETVAALDVVYLSDGTGGLTAGRWYKTDADLVYKSSEASLVGVVITPVLNAAESGTIRLQGTVDGYAGLSIGSTYYASATAGGIVSAAPPNAKVIGIATTATALLLTPAAASSSELGVFTKLQVSSGAVDALIVGGGIQAGSGVVQVVDATGKIPAIDSTRFASLSGVNLTGVAKPASNETITGSWVFSSALSLQSIADAAGSAIRLRGRASDNIGIAHFFNNAGSVVQAQIQSAPTVFSLFGPGLTEGLRLSSTAITPLLPVVSLQVGGTGAAGAGKIGLNADVLSFLGGSSGHAFLTSGGGVTTQVDAAGNWTLTGRMRTPSGSVASPGLQVGDASSGLSRFSGINEQGLAISSQGATVARFYGLNGEIGQKSIEVPDTATGVGPIPGNTVVIGRNSSGSGAAGFLSLTDRNGLTRVLWVDAAGKLRIGGAAPTEDGFDSDTGGTVVGTQI